MSLTSTASALASRQADPAAVIRTCPDDLVRAVRAEVRRGRGWQDTADGVAAALRASLPDPAHLLQGTGKRHRHVKLTTPADLAAPALRELLEAARDR